MSEVCLLFLPLLDFLMRFFTCCSLIFVSDFLIKLVAFRCIIFLRDLLMRFLAFLPVVSKYSVVWGLWRGYDAKEVVSK